MLSLDGVNSYHLFADHLHDLPFVAVLGRATILATAGTSHIAQLLDRHVSFDYDFRGLPDECLHSFFDGVADFHEPSFIKVHP